MNLLLVCFPPVSAVRYPVLECTYRVSPSELNATPPYGNAPKSGDDAFHFTVPFGFTALM